MSELGAWRRETGVDGSGGLLPQTATTGFDGPTTVDGTGEDSNDECERDESISELISCLECATAAPTRNRVRNKYNAIFE